MKIEWGQMRINCGAASLSASVALWILLVYIAATREPVGNSREIPWFFWVVPGPFLVIGGLLVWWKLLPSIVRVRHILKVWMSINITQIWWDRPEKGQTTIYYDDGSTLTIAEVPPPKWAVYAMLDKYMAPKSKQ